MADNPPFNTHCSKDVWKLLVPIYTGFSMGLKSTGVCAERVLLSSPLRITRQKRVLFAHVKHMQTKLSGAKAAK
jgi:hypothetical protein